MSPNTDLVLLDASIEPFRAWFNTNAGLRRFVALTSPTWGACLDGARAVLANVVEPFAARGLSIAAVWIPMLPDDGPAAATDSSRMFDDRVAQFFDGARLLGETIAASLGAASTAWDVYLAYGRNERWDDGGPAPVEYVHQLGSWADASRYRTGDALALEIGRVAAVLMG